MIYWLIHLSIKSLLASRVNCANGATWRIWVENPSLSGLPSSTMSCRIAFHWIRRVRFGMCWRNSTWRRASRNILHWREVMLLWWDSIHNWRETYGIGSVSGLSSTLTRAHGRIFHLFLPRSRNFATRRGKCIGRWWRWFPVSAEYWKNWLSLFSTQEN